MAFVAVRAATRRCTRDAFSFTINTPRDWTIRRGVFEIVFLGGGFWVVGVFRVWESFDVEFCCYLGMRKGRCVVIVRMFLEFVVWSS